jgi:hypothetical protein
VKDRDSFSLWFSIAAAPLNFATGVVDVDLLRHVVDNKMFSNSTRMFATVLKVSKQGVDSVGLSLGFAKLMNKPEEQNDSLEYLNFALCTFFFSNTLIHPAKAASIVRQAKEANISDFANGMSDNEIMATFHQFMEGNEDKVDEENQPRIVRKIYRIDGAKQIFGELAEDEIEEEEEKIEEILVIENKMIENVNFYPKVRKLLAEISLKEIESNIFDNLDNEQISRANHTFGISAALNIKIIITALEICSKLDFNSPDEVFSVTEIIVTKMIKDFPHIKTSEIDEIQLINVNNDDFIHQIKDDLNVARKLNKNKRNWKFEEPHLAVCNFYKHGADFPSRIRGVSVKVYVKKTPPKIIKDGNLVKIENFYEKNEEEEKILIYSKKSYLTTEGQFVVVLEYDGIKILSSIFLKPAGSYVKHDANSVNMLKKLKLKIKGKTKYLAKAMEFKGIYHKMIENIEKQFDSLVMTGMHLKQITDGSKIVEESAEEKEEKLWNIMQQSKQENESMVFDFKKLYKKVEKIEGTQIVDETKPDDGNNSDDEENFELIRQNLESEKVNETSESEITPPIGTVLKKKWSFKRKDKPEKIKKNSQKNGETSLDNSNENDDEIIGVNDNVEEDKNDKTERDVENVKAIKKKFSFREKMGMKKISKKSDDKKDEPPPESNENENENEVPVESNERTIPLISNEKKTTDTQPEENSEKITEKQTESEAADIDDKESEGKSSMNTLAVVSCIVGGVLLVGLCWRTLRHFNVLPKRFL